MFTLTNFAFISKQSVSVKFSPKSMVFIRVSLEYSQWQRPISVRLWKALNMKMKAIKVANNSSVNL